MRPTATSASDESSTVAGAPSNSGLAVTGLPPTRDFSLLDLLRRPFLRKSVFSVVDQAALSSINFLTSILAARLLAEASYGAYGFGLMLVSLARTVQHAVVGEAQEVLLAPLTGEAWQRCVRTLLTLNTALALLFGTGFAIAGLLVDDAVVASGLFGASLAAVSFLPHDFVRRTFLAALRVERTLGLSLMRFGTHFLLLLLVIAIGWFDVVPTFFVQAVATSLVVLYGHVTVLRGLGPLMRLDRAELRSIFDFTRWITLKNITRYVLLFTNHWLVLLLHGLTASARLAAVGIPVTALTFVATGLSGFFSPYFAGLYAARPDLFRRRILLAGMGWLATFILPSIAMLVAPATVLHLFVGDRYGDAVDLVRLCGVVAPLTLFATFLEIPFKAMRRARELWRLQAMAMLPGVAISYYAISRWSVAGSLYCLAFQLCAVDVTLLFALLRLLREPRTP